LFVLQEELEKARASARRLEAELGETKRQLTDAKKEVGEQQTLVKQLLEQAVPVKKAETCPVKKSSDTMVVVYLPKKMKKGGPRDGSAPEPVASILRSM